MKEIHTRYLILVSNKSYMISKRIIKDKSLKGKSNRIGISNSERIQVCYYDSVICKADHNWLLTKYKVRPQYATRKVLFLPQESTAAGSGDDSDFLLKVVSN